MVEYKEGLAIKFKKKIVSALVLALTVATVNITGYAEPVLLSGKRGEIKEFSNIDKRIGDVNIDGLVDAVDALIVLKYAAHITTVDINMGDVNGDKISDADDSLLILEKSAGLINEFPCEDASKEPLPSPAQTNIADITETPLPTWEVTPDITATPIPTTLQTATPIPTPPATPIPALTSIPPAEPEVVMIRGKEELDKFRSMIKSSDEEIHSYLFKTGFLYNNVTNREDMINLLATADPLTVAVTQPSELIAFDFFTGKEKSFLISFSDTYGASYSYIYMFRNDATEYIEGKTGKPAELLYENDNMKVYKYPYAETIDPDRVFTRFIMELDNQSIIVTYRNEYIENVVGLDAEYIFKDLKIQSVGDF